MPKALLELQSMLAEHRHRLLQNRLALVGLTRLNPASASLGEQQAELIESLVTTRQEEFAALDSKSKLPTIAGAPTEFLTFLNRDLSVAFSPLLEKTRMILGEQQALIDELSGFTAAISDIFYYNPGLDLGNLDISADKEEIIERANGARFGLENISKNFEKLELGVTSDEIERMKKEIQATREELESLIYQLENGEYSAARTARGAVINHFYTLKQLALDAQNTLIRSDSSVKLLTQQTNLILEYDFWLKKISRYQARLTPQ